MVAGNSTYGPVGSTWALQKDGLGDAGFSALPSTTPFNLEAIAVDAWPYAARSREVFSGDDQFFEGVLSRTLELNRADNPFSALTVVRALVLAAELGFRIGPKLVEYIASEGLALGADELEQLQQQHYGHIRISGRTLRALATSIGQHSGRAGSIDAPTIGQLPLWREEGGCISAAGLLPRLLVQIASSIGRIGFVRVASLP